MVKLSDDIKIEPIDCELSENTKKYIEWLEWVNKLINAYCNDLFMIR